jgi:hypothetical protein
VLNPVRSNIADSKIISFQHCYYFVGGHFAEPFIAGQLRNQKLRESDYTAVLAWTDDDSRTQGGPWK